MNCLVGPSGSITKRRLTVMSGNESMGWTVVAGGVGGVGGSLAPPSIAASWRARSIVLFDTVGEVGVGGSVAGSIAASCSHVLPDSEVGVEGSVAGSIAAS